MHQSWTCKPQKPLVRKNRDRLPQPNAVALPLGFEGQSMNKQNEKEIMRREITQKINLNAKELVARLTVECHKFLNHLFYKRTTHEP